MMETECAAAEPSLGGGFLMNMNAGIWLRPGRTRRTTMTARARLASMALLAVSIALGSAWLTASAARPDDSTDVKLVVMNWDGFKTRLAQAKAFKFKYTIVDAWSTTCGPCKENFPHLVEMYQKYGSKGLQVISLSLDDTTDAKAVEAAKKFLVEKKATFLNILLDEELGVGFEKLNINAIPAVFLYGPDGKEVQRFTMDDVNNQFTYQQVEEKVASLLGVKSAAAK
jgi:thiol-disulfide isomerase/thioredoxin